MKKNPKILAKVKKNKPLLYLPKMMKVMVNINFRCNLFRGKPTSTETNDQKLFESHSAKIKGIDSKTAQCLSKNRKKVTK